ncbi:MAG TPA: hypothetical protein VMZ28_13280 [Kofleriaceae bacterium]|nr:hypothetical protein [Kofleriaceae bacterium]
MARLGGGWLVIVALGVGACADVGPESVDDAGGPTVDAAPVDPDEETDDDEDPERPVIGGGGCGDYVCDDGEDCATCADDCFCSAEVGNDVCDVGEAATTAPADCGTRGENGLLTSEDDEPGLIVVWTASSDAGGAAARENLLAGCASNPDAWCFRRFFSRLMNDYAYLPDIVAIRDLGGDASRPDVIAQLKRQLDLLADGDAATEEYATRSGDGGLIAWRVGRFSLGGEVLRLRERVETAGQNDCGEVRVDGAGDPLEDAILAVQLVDQANDDRRLAVSTMGLASEADGGTCQAQNFGRVLFQARKAWGSDDDPYPDILIMSAETNQKADSHDDCDSDAGCVQSWRQELDPTCDPDDAVAHNGWYERVHPLLAPSTGCLARVTSSWDPVALVQRSMELAGPGGTRPAGNICAHFTSRTIGNIGQDLYGCTSTRGRIDHTLVRLEREDGTRIDDPREAREHIPNAKTDEGAYPAGSADPNDHYGSHRAEMIWLRW